VTQAVVDPALAAFGRRDALLNIAGAVPQIDPFRMTDAQCEAGLALKLHGAPADDCRLAGAKDGKGRRSADVGQLGALSESALRGCRHYQRRLVALAKAFSDRGIVDGVRVNSVLLGPVVTGWCRSYLEHWRRCTT
jgi:NAD(P)-dependent dehydrogenase (short-subunit alcohol dehydrogenase family)